MASSLSSAEARRSNILSRAAGRVRVLGFVGLLAGLPHMVVMEVIVRHQDRGALRLDHLHNTHYAGGGVVI